MEHIVQFAVGIDDAKIQQIMEERAAKQIMEEIKEASHGIERYTGKIKSEPENLKALFQEEIANYVSEHADLVIDLAVKEVAKNMMKTKKVKEALETVVNE